MREINFINKYLPSLETLAPPRVSAMAFATEGFSATFRAVMDIWICDTEPPRSLKLMEGCKTPIIVSTRRLWHSRMEDYSYQSVKVKHSECGGVTDGTWVFHVYRRDEGRDPAGPCKTAGRDMLSIIDSKRGGTSCPPPLM